MKNYSFVCEKPQPLVDFLRNNLAAQGVRSSILLNSDVYVNELQLSSKDWEAHVLQEGDKVDLYPNIHAETIALGIVAALKLTGALAAVTTTILTVAIAGVGSFVLSWGVSKLFPSKTPKAATVESTQSVPTIQGATNPYRPHEPLPMVVGTMRVVPDHAVMYYSIIEDGLLKIRHLFCVSAGEVDVWDIRKESTPVAELGITTHVHSGWAGEPLVWFDDTVTPTPENFVTTNYSKYVSQSPIGATGFACIVQFQGGLCNISLKNGNKNRHSVGFSFTFENLESGETVEHRRGFDNATPNTSTYRHYFDFKLEQGNWKVTVFAFTWDWGTEVACNNFTSRDLSFVVENTITETQWVHPDPAVKYSGKSCTLIELEAVAGDKLTGALNSINCMARLRGKRADGSLVDSSNTALLVRRILTDPNIIEHTEYVIIDEDSFVRFEEHCDRYGFTANAYEKTGRTVGEVIEDMLEIAQGYLSDSSGVCELFYDNPDAPIVDVIHSRNSWGLTIGQNLPPEPIDELRVVFNNAEKDYQTDEREVREDGVVPVNSQEVSNAFIDNAELAYKYGILNIAMQTLRKSVYRYNTDWRSIDYKLGQKVLIQHPVFFLGIGTAGKVLGYTQEGSAYTGVVLDQSYSTELGKTYVLMSSQKYAQQLWDIKPIANEITDTLQFTVPIYTTSGLPTIGVMCAFGESEKVGVEVLIRNITRNIDFTAEVEALPASPEYYDAITGTIPEFESSLSFPTQWDRSSPNTPAIVGVAPVRESTTKDYNNRIRTDVVVSIELAPKRGVQFSHYVVGIRPIQENLEAQEPVTDYEVESQLQDFVYVNSSEMKEYTFKSLYQYTDYEISVKAVSMIGLESNTVTSTYKYTDIVTSYYSVSGLYATIEPTQGVVLNWETIASVDLDSYIISGAVQATVKSPPTTLNSLVGLVGVLEFSVVAKDRAGLLSQFPATASVLVEPPIAPTVTSRINTGLELRWNDCQSTWPIQEYRVTDRFLGTTTSVYSESLYVEPRAFGEYLFDVTAVDVYGNRSSTSVYTLAVDAIQAPQPTMSVVGGVLRISWDAVASPFPVSTYEIFTTTGQLLHSTPSTFYDVPPDAENPAGVLEYLIRAVDSVGNVSDFSLFSELIATPDTPNVIVHVSEDKRQVVVSWSMPRSQVPIEGYDLVAQYDVEGRTREVDYGFYDTTVAYVEALSAEVDDGTYTFMVRARNYMNMTGEWGYNTLTVAAPSIVLFTKSFSIDNDMKLYWNPPAQSTFAIRTYNVWKKDGAVQSSAEFVSQGSNASTWMSSFEDKAGDYTFRVAAVDWAGNVGDTNDVVVTMDEPPDFNLFNNFDSDFVGEKNNFVVIDGLMLGGVVAGETWQENVDRIGVDNALTWQEKHDMGYEYFPSPHTATSTYTETVDHGVIIASTRITVTPTYQVLEGTPELRCKIEISRDGTNWVTAIENGLDVYALQFRYVRYTLSILDGLVSFSNINFKLSVKLKKDSGVVYYDAALGFEGVYVPFSTLFIALHGQPIVSVDENTFAEPLYAYVNFDGSVTHPLGFFVYVLDKNGNPHDGTVSWIANGV